MFSTFGTLFRASTFGESHGRGVGVVIDGCPARLPLTEADIQPQLDRRRPGQSRLTTEREEADQVTILSGTQNGLTLGTPIGLMVPNRDQRPADYEHLDRTPRPSHADFTYQVKYGIRAASGGGRASARGDHRPGGGRGGGRKIPAGAPRRRDRRLGERGGRTRCPGGRRAAHRPGRRTRLPNGTTILCITRNPPLGIPAYQRLDENILKRRFNHHTLQTVVVFFCRRRNPPLKNSKKGGCKR